MAPSSQKKKDPQETIIVVSLDAKYLDLRKETKESDVSIRVIGFDTTIHFEHERWRQFHKLFQRYSEIKGIKKADLWLFYERKLVNESDSPSSLGMADEVTIRAYRTLSKFDSTLYLYSYE